MGQLRRSFALIVVFGLVAASCSQSPEAKKARHLERADKHFSRQQFREAIIEYRNVMQLDKTNARAIRQLGLAHYQLGELGLAFPYLRRSKELEPDDAEVRIKLGTMQLLSGRAAEAREEAAFLLGKDPKNLDALLLLAGTANTPKEADATIRRFEGVRADFGGRAKFHLALASLYLRRQDMESTESSLREAVALEPRSVEAHTALGNFSVVKRDLPQAEREYKAAADLEPIGSPARIRLADFYVLLGKPEEARRVLGEVTEKAPEFLPAWRRLAEIAFAEGKFDESLKTIETILKKNSSDLDGLTLRGRIRMAKRETTEAIQDFQKVLKLEPRLAPVRFQLALAFLQGGNLQQARAELKEVTTTAPDFAEAALLLAELNIQTGALQPAIEAMEGLIAKRPNEVKAYVLLGSAYLAKRDSVKATDAYRKVVALAPKDPRGPYLVGLGLRMQGKSAEAKKEFQAALNRAPGYVEPLAQLVAMAFAEKQPGVALEHVKKQIALVPKSGMLQYMLGRVHVARRETSLAEGAFLKAIELQPNLVDAYVQLGSLYATATKYDQALAKLKEGLTINPNSLQAHMLSGTIHERKGDIPKAQEAYEKVLALNLRFAPAANNLAWLYSEHGGDKERALQLAQLAKEVAPEDPRISDTLGWILYKRGVFQRALALLQESAAKVPDVPDVQYHLGMTYYKLGNKDAAKRTLAQALRSGSAFSGVEEARRTLAELN